MIHWVLFDKFFRDMWARLGSEEPVCAEAIFIFDNSPTPSHSGQAAVASQTHSIKRLPPYSSFYNLIEVFKSFRSEVGAFLNERRDLALSSWLGMMKREHRRCFLLDVPWHYAANTAGRVRCFRLPELFFHTISSAGRHVIKCDVMLLPTQRSPDNKIEFKRRAVRRFSAHFLNSSQHG